jgi:hypothetical protein
MAYRTAHMAERPLALAVAERLATHGFRFPAVFPYNRFDAEHTIWWMSFKASPAHAAAKVFVGRLEKGGALRAGLVVEKGFEHELVAASQRFDQGWDWHAVTARMREKAYLDLLAAQAAHKPRLRVHAFQGQPPQVHAHYLSFQVSPWKRTLDGPEGTTNRVMGAVADAAGPGALLDGLMTLSGHAFTWYDLYTCVQLHPARAGDDPVRLDERLVDDFLAPLCRLVWPGLAKAGGAR